jgi:acylphosphatase
VPTVCCRFIVHGLVQGVFFRDSARREARVLGLSGHALNLPDGTVEVLACGDASSLAKLQSWLGDGPPMADVERVERMDLNVERCLPDDVFRVG